jgi:hypothetical protein
MIPRTIRASVLLSGAALMLASAALQASPVKSEKFEIPFSFKVQTHTLPAGEYQIQQATESEFAVLVNAKTGERVEVLRPATIRQTGKARLVFEQDGNVQVLKQIS